MGESAGFLAWGGFRAPFLAFGVWVISFFFGLSLGYLVPVSLAFSRVLWYPVGVRWLGGCGGALFGAVGPGPPRFRSGRAFARPGPGGAGVGASLLSGGPFARSGSFLPLLSGGLFPPSAAVVAVPSAASGAVFSPRFVSVFFPASAAVAASAFASRWAPFCGVLPVRWLPLLGVGPAFCVRVPLRAGG